MKQVVWSIQLQLLKIGPYTHITGMEHAVFRCYIFSTLLVYGLYAEKSSDFCDAVETTLSIVEKSGN